MNTSYGLLKILILAGCLPLLARQARVQTVRASFYELDCVTFGNQTQYNCPSPGGSCPSTYYAYPELNDSGFQADNHNSTPCGTGCTQPEEAVYTTQPAWDCQGCCLGPGQSSTPASVAARARVAAASPATRTTGIAAHRCTAIATWTRIAAAGRPVCPISVYLRIAFDLGFSYAPGL